jgi:plastocyanin
MTCGNFFFTPSPDTAVAGTVHFQYEDVAHQVQFDTGPSMVGVNLPQGQNTTQDVTVVPGTYTYHCNLHSYMHGTLIVH